MPVFGAGDFGVGGGSLPGRERTPSIVPRRQPQPATSPPVRSESGSVSRVLLSIQIVSVVELFKTMKLLLVLAAVVAAVAAEVYFEERFEDGGTLSRCNFILT